MAGTRSSPVRHLVAVAIGAGLGGVLGLVAAPDYFWALLIGGALLGGAVRVGLLLARGGAE